MNLWVERTVAVCARCGTARALDGPEDVNFLLTLVDDYGWSYEKPHYSCEKCGPFRSAEPS